MSELNDIASSGHARASEGKQPSGSGSSGRKGRGKQRKRGGSKKADSDVSAIVEDGDQSSNLINRGGGIPDPQTKRGSCSFSSSNQSRGQR